MRHTKRCRGTETRFTHLPVRDAVDACGCPRVARMESLRCTTCSTWLPLGPSDETPVAVEVRAADLSSLARSHATSSESHGWELCRRDADLPGPFEDDPEYLAGWYARLIFDHDMP